MTDVSKYKSVALSHDSCVKDGLGQSFEVFFNGEMLKSDQINNSRLYPKFVCEPFKTEEAET